MSFKTWLRGLFPFSSKSPAAESSGKVVISSPHSAMEEMTAPTDSYAMKVAAVCSAVKLISEGIAKLPMELQVFNSARNFFEPYISSPLFSVLHLRPNARMSAYELVRNAVQQMLLRGNAYLLPRRNIYGEVEQLILLSPGSVVHDVYSDTYVVTDTVNMIAGAFASHEIVHLRNTCVDGGYSGESTVSMAAKSLGISVLATRNTATTLSNGGRIRGIVSGDNGGLPTMPGTTHKQTSDVSDRIESQLAEGKTIIPMPAEMKFQAISLSPADARVLESQQMSIREIARFFRVHPELLYEGTNNTYKSSEVPNVMFLTQTLAPLLVQIESELLIKLVPRTLWSRLRIHFDREAMYLTDLGTEAAYIKSTLEAGVYTVNDWRAKKGLPAINNGDAVLVSANLKTLNALVAEGDSTNPENS